ncbi:MAG: YggS family pyridoxal phosphate-dependent enzyme [Nitrospiria bacterium]
MNTIHEALTRVSGAIQTAAERAGRSSQDITLIAASKRVAPEQVEAAIAWGVHNFGENRVQEGRAKFLETGLAQKIDGLHLIGPLQRNKVNKAVGVFDVIHSVDTLPLAEKINQEAERQSIRQSILVEVNIGGETSKHGVSVQETPALVKKVQALPNLALLGLMTLPPRSNDPEAARPYFSALRRLGNDLGLMRFSMGMSSDFEIAIEEGATWVRIGTAIFGRRIN